MEQLDARKSTISGDAALTVLRDVDELFATKGKKVIHLLLAADRPADRPDKATLRALLIGPSGNLRAPTLRIGRTLIVGFDQATYEQLLLGRKPGS